MMALPAPLAQRSGIVLAAAAVVALGIALLAARIGVGAAVLLAGLAVLAVVDRKLFIVAVAGSASLATLGWTIPIAEISGRTLDARLVLTFGVAGIAVGALALQRGRLTLLDAAFGGFIAVVALSGVLRSDSVLVWGPPIARFVSYAAVLALARQVAFDGRELRTLIAVICLAFVVPTVMGIAQFLIGDASFLNGAVRATAPGDRGPIALAFDGQMVMLTGYALAMTAATVTWRRIWLAMAALGAIGLYSSATRLVTVTGWGAVAVWEALRRRWKHVAVIGILAVASLLARPDLLARFLDTYDPGQGSGACDVAEPGKDCSELDASLRFRFFVWDIILGAWREQPVLGIGPGMTAVLVAEVSPAERTAPHNDHIGILAETGVVGLTLYLVLQAGVIIGLYRVRRASVPPTREMVSVALIGFVAVNVLGALDNPIYFVDLQLPLWAMIGASLGLPAVTAEPTTA